MLFCSLLANIYSGYQAAGREENGESLSSDVFCGYLWYGRIFSVMNELFRRILILRSSFSFKEFSMERRTAWQCRWQSADINLMK